MSFVTPKKGITWYIKWGASIIILFAVACRSVEEVPRIYDIVFSLIGCLGWFVVGFMWHDRALMVLNSILVFMLLLSLLRFVFGG